jgi:fido (protein-threonine AMPylation protein)
MPDPVSTEGLLRWHRATFRTTFPEHAGRFRDDGVSFGIRWREGERERRVMAVGSPVERMGDELDAAFAAYNAEIARCAPERRSAREAAVTAATLYAELLRIHPFPDGNLRASLGIASRR